MKLKKSLLALTMATTFVLAGCGKSNETTTPSSTPESGQKVEESSVQETSESTESEENLAEVKSMEGPELDEIEGDDNKKEDYLVVDVRGNDQYLEGHLKQVKSIILCKFNSTIFYHSFFAHFLP